MDETNVSYGAATGMVFMEECLDGSMNDQVVKHDTWTLRVTPKSGFNRSK